MGCSNKAGRSQQNQFSFPSPLSLLPSNGVLPREFPNKTHQIQRIGLLDFSAPPFEMSKPRVFSIQQGTSGRFPPVPVTITLSSFTRSESPSLEPSSPLIPKLAIHYAPESGEKGEFAMLATNVRQWRDSTIPCPSSEKQFYGNPETLDVLKQLVDQGAVKKVDGVQGQRHGDEVLELYEVVEEQIEIVKVKDTGAGGAAGSGAGASAEKCAVCGKKGQLNKCGNCKKVCE